MQPRIDWPGICEDWATSGLTKQRYFMTTRFERFVRYGTIPGYSTVIHHLTAYEKNGRSVAEKRTPAAAEVAIVHHLSEQDVRTALSSTSANGYDIGGNNHVTMVLANGTTIEFEAENAERFALQALSLGRQA